MDREFLGDLAAFICGVLATIFFYFSMLFLFGDGDTPGLVVDLVR